MKTQSTARLVSIAFLVAIALGICSVTAETLPPLKALNLEQTQGEVRVLLLRAGKINATNDAKPLVLTFAVEVPAKGAFSDLHFNSADEITLTTQGKPIKMNSFSGSLIDFKDLSRQNELTRPMVKEGKQMIAEEIVLKDINLDVHSIDVKFHFLWRGNKMNFVFKDVPLN
jgi:hypothetical protein